MKYFQNEITNLEAKCLALEFAILAGDNPAANKVADELARTERNFVLKKGETTIDLEKARIGYQKMRDIVTILKDVLPLAKSKAAS